MAIKSNGFDHRVETAETGSTVSFDVSLTGPAAGLVRPLTRLVCRPQMERALDLLVTHAEADQSVQG